MSIESQTLVWAHSTAEGAELLALLCIADHDGDGGSWPSMDTIAQRARVSRDHARKLVRRLEQRGEIVTDTNGGGGLRTAAHMRTNRYEITIDCPPTCDRSARHRDRPESVDNTPQPHGGDPAARRGAPQPHGGANHPLTPHTQDELSRSEVMAANDRGNESPNERGKPPSRFGKIAAAHKLAAEARRREQYLPPQRDEPVSDARRHANELANTLRCPQGVGNGSSSRHLVLVGTGTTCARCEQDTFTILDQHNQLETE